MKAAVQVVSVHELFLFRLEEKGYNSYASTLWHYASSLIHGVKALLALAEKNKMVVTGCFAVVVFVSLSLMVTSRRYSQLPCFMVDT